MMQPYVVYLHAISLVAHSCCRFQRARGVLIPTWQAAGLAAARHGGTARPAARPADRLAGYGLRVSYVKPHGASPPCRSVSAPLEPPCCCLFTALPLRFSFVLTALLLHLHCVSVAHRLLFPLPCCCVFTASSSLFFAAFSVHCISTVFSPPFRCPCTASPQTFCGLLLIFPSPLSPHFHCCVFTASLPLAVSLTFCCLSGALNNVACVDRAVADAISQAVSA